MNRVHPGSSPRGNDPAPGRRSPRSNGIPPLGLASSPLSQPSSGPEPPTGADSDNSTGLGGGGGARGPTKKRIVLCFDGTWNIPRTQFPTNVLRFARAVSPVSEIDGLPQVVFYDWGVGTGESRWSRMLGGFSGRGLERNVEDGYRFLVHNWAEGDDVFIVGFSRGAYTARSLVGLLNNCGLLRKEHSIRIPEAMRLYKSRNDEDHPSRGENARHFRSRYSVRWGPVRVKFLGVFDTVGALGIPNIGCLSFRNKAHRFHDVSLSPIVDSAFHAIAIDEHRDPFAPSIWSGEPRPGCKVEQVWYPGAHSDVGGGITAERRLTAKERGLQDLGLHDMVDRARAEGLAFELETLHKLRPDAGAPVHNSLKGVHKISKRIIRPIGTGVNEALHPGVQERIEDTASKKGTSRYAPANVLNFLKKLAKSGTTSSSSASSSRRQGDGSVGEGDGARRKRKKKKKRNPAEAAVAEK